MECEDGFCKKVMIFEKMIQNDIFCCVITIVKRCEGRDKETEAKDMPIKLTTKQEKFVQNLVAGMTQREAYKNSYNAGKMSDKTIDNKAYTLFKKDEIRARYEELMQELEDAAIMTAKERLKYLSDLVKDIEAETVTKIINGEAVEIKIYADFDQKIRAIDTMNKMTGEYTNKVEAELKVKKLEDLL